MSKKKADGIAAFNRLFYDYKRNAERKGLVFNISKEEFRKFTKRNCSYCGVNPNSVAKNKKDIYIYNGIDRVDNNIGYIKENLATCCSICNQAKHKMSEKDFLSWVTRIYKYQNRKGE